MRRWCVLLVLLVPCWSLAQDPTLVPDLLTALRGPQPDTARVQSLVKLCFNLTRSSPDSARMFGEQGLALARSIGDTRSIADAHNNLGWLALNQGDLPRAQTQLDSALLLFEDLGEPRWISVARSNLGWLAERKGDRAGALKQFQEALKQSEAVNDNGNTAVLLYNIGTIYNKMEEFARARELFARSLELERALGRPDKQANSLMGIGNTYRSEGDAARALEHYEQAGPIFRRIGDHNGAGLVAENAGALFDGSDPDKALAYYRVALREYAIIGSGTDQAYALLSMGATQMAMGLLQQADSSFGAGAALAAASGEPELMMEYEQRQAELASAQGDSKATLMHYERYVALKDSLRNAGTENELMRLRTEFETERAEKDNELLRLKDQENTERLRARNLQLYGSLVLAALALGAVVLVWRNLQQRRKHQIVLEGLNTELRVQKSRIEEINGLLRLKVLRTQMDPHFIHNCLNAIRALSLKGEHERAEEYLEGFARLLRNVLEHSVRDRISLDEEIAFLNDYVRLEQLRLGDDFTWSITADDALLDEEPQVPSLLVQPFVENAIWHGLAPKQGPKRLEVHFFQVDGVVACRVRDNGVGRTEKAATPGRTSLGLKLTGERLELLTERMRSAGGFRVEDLKDPIGAPSGTLVEMRLAV
ncbi:MAG: tetratricopeptide repeat protein [Flavobacteriales bacterium]|nr:MAG: tetratricopeptide repeat protein [Flavobacteriales bacterium]